MLDFGREVPRDVPVTNPRLSTRQQRYEGEYRLFIQCAWRIELDGEVVCGSGDDIEPGSAMAGGVQKLIDQDVMLAHAQPPAWDLTLRLSNGSELKVFCDRTNVEEDEENYSLTSGGTTVVVGPCGKIEVERSVSN
jgi:hypothetical protein